MDSYRGDRYGDYSDSHRSSHPATSSRSVDDHPGPRYDGNNVNYRGNFPEDGHHYHRPYRNHHNHPSNHRYDHNFNGEQNDFVGCGSNGDFGRTHFPSISGRKRPSTSGDYIDGGNYVKLYVGAVPRTVTEGDIRSLFGQHGNIVEVVLLKDKRTGQQQECCFVKYAMLEEADRAIGALHNQYIFPGGMVPIKVRYAEGERERLGDSGMHVFKLYVGCLSKQASRREVEEIFSAYGLVEDVYIVQNELKQNRGYGFIQFSRRDMAVAAINALNGTYIMRGCDQPLIVRFADPKKQRTGEPRGNSRIGAASFGPCFQQPVRPAPNFNDPLAGHMLPNASHPLSPKSAASCSQSSLTGSKPQTLSATSTALELHRPSTILSAPVLPTNTQTADTLDCDWSEHTCPDGYKYYYNCVTCESRWEKPAEYTLYEQQLQKQQKQQEQQHPSCQQLHTLSSSQALSAQEVSQTQQIQLQTQEFSHVQVQAVTSPEIAPTCA